MEYAMIFFRRSSVASQPHPAYLVNVPMTRIMLEDEGCQDETGLMLFMKNMIASVTNTIAEPSHSTIFH